MPFRPSDSIDENVFSSTRFAVADPKSFGVNLGKEWHNGHGPTLRQGTPNPVFHHSLTRHPTPPPRLAKVEETSVNLNESLHPAQATRPSAPATRSFLIEMFSLGALVIAAIFFMISLSHEFPSPDLLQSPNKIGITSWHSWPKFTLVNRDELTIIWEDLNRVKKELYLLRRDSLGIPDFALRHRGGQAIDNLTTPLFNAGHNPPSTALDDFKQPGQCWRFQGSAGQLGVRLTQKVAISSVTVDHVPRELVASVDAAPKNMVLWGVSDNNLTMPELAGAGGGRRLPALVGGHDFLVSLASFRFDPYAASDIQTFSLKEEVRYQVFDKVIFEVLDNWGAEFTCLYRVRVHGNPAG